MPVTRSIWAFVGEAVDVCGQRMPVRYRDRAAADRIIDLRDARELHRSAVRTVHLLPVHNTGGRGVGGISQKHLGKSSPK